MMKRYLPIVLIYLFLTGSAIGGQQQLLGRLARVNAVSVPDGLIGSTNEASNQVVPVAHGYFNVLTTTTAGNVRYAHINVKTAEQDETICLALQADSDGGTVHLSGSTAVAVGSGHVEIDMGSAFTLLAATNYRLTILVTGSTIDIEASAFGTGDFRRDTTVAYSCGVSLTDDAQENQRTLAVIWNNVSGDPF